MFYCKDVKYDMCELKKKIIKKNKICKEFDDLTFNWSHVPHPFFLCPHCPGKMFHSVTGGVNLPRLGWSSSEWRLQRFLKLNLEVCVTHLVQQLQTACVNVNVDRQTLIDIDR